MCACFYWSNGNSRMTPMYKASDAHASSDAHRVVYMDVKSFSAVIQPPYYLLFHRYLRCYYLQNINCDSVFVWESVTFWFMSDKLSFVTLDWNFQIDILILLCVGLCAYEFGCGLNWMKDDRGHIYELKRTSWE